MARIAGDRKVVAQNRRAFHDYAVEERVEAGLVLSGTEVKSLREGRATISEAHAGEMGGELWLFNAYIPEFHGGNRFNHEVRRPRKLMLRKREVAQLFGAVRRDGHDPDPAGALLHAARLGQGRAGPGQGQEASRQARRDQGARLAAREAAAAAPEQ